jgi:hypothetical protein
MSYEIISNEMKGILHINITNLNIQTWALFERLHYFDIPMQCKYSSTIDYIIYLSILISIFKKLM